MDKKTKKRITAKRRRKIRAWRRNRIIKNTLFSIAGVTLFFTIVNVMYPIIKDAYYGYRKNHPNYGNDTACQWTDANSLASYLSGKGQMNIYESDINLNSDSNNSIFYDGVGLYFLYNNFEDVDRVITGFSIYATDIVEDDSPILDCACNFYDSNIMDCMVLDIENTGWADSDNIKISFESILGCKGNYTSDENLEEQDVIVVNPGSKKQWEIERIIQGDSIRINLLSYADFKVLDLETVTKYNFFVCKFQLSSGEIEQTIGFKLNWNGENFEAIGGEGGAGGYSYVCRIKTGQTEWYRHYTVNQILEAKSVTELPITIVPTQSSFMTIRVIFDTLDGESIEATLLENAHFIIKRESLFLTYVDGEKIDWSNFDETYDSVCFPYTAMIKR